MSEKEKQRELAEEKLKAQAAKAAAGGTNDRPGLEIEAGADFDFVGTGLVGNAAAAAKEGGGVAIDGISNSQWHYFKFFMLKFNVGCSRRGCLESSDASPATVLPVTTDALFVLTVLATRTRTTGR